jgi:hypothetical protein
MAIKLYSMIKPTFITLVCLMPLALGAQQAATIRETTKTYTTYPFSDPDPIPSTEKIYPYYRFDGFTDKPVQRGWKVVELENDFIKVQIMPEIGGKIWAAFDKIAQRDFLYNNGVVKFRDIAMRGPWTSGGIEANYGVIGHTPNTSTPVDYLTRTNKDGSVSCFISTLDLLTRTRWVLEIKLERDKAFFSTKSFWSNTNPIEQPYYTWMNLGVPAGEDLQFIYPGNHYIGHDGDSHSWPIDNKGRDLSFYQQNNFEGSKSYHVLGTHSNYFSAYWKDHDYGMVRYADREDKLGKKIFLWAQSGEGKIWETLLTDKSGQYVEIQSGRLFNQNVFESSFTPFKQLGFAPYQSDVWTEYWYPYKNIGKPVGANLLGTFTISRQANKVRIKLNPNCSINDSLSLYNEGGEIIASKHIKLAVGQILDEEVILPPNEIPKRLKLQGAILDFSNAEREQDLRRPLDTPADVDTATAYGLYLQGRDLMRFRKYSDAEPKIRQSLRKEAYFVPSLVEMAKLQWFHMAYDSVYFYAQKALSIDTYHAEANYYYGLASAKLGKSYDALDGFEVASLDPAMQSAAYTALSKSYMCKADFFRSLDYAQRALKNNQTNIEALQLRYLSARLFNLTELKDSVGKDILRLDPLNHFVRFEQYLVEKNDRRREHFISLIRNEMPVQTFLELAIWYANLQQYQAAKEVLALAPKNVEVLYWLAWLNRDRVEEQHKWLGLAQKADMQQIFPFREESAEVLNWALQEDVSWRSPYLLALIQSFRNNKTQAFQLLSKVTEAVNFAPFYILRARLTEEQYKDRQLKDLEQAVKINNKEWRYGQLLARFFTNKKMYEQAQKVLKPYYEANPANYIVGMDYVRTLILSHDYLEAENVLKHLIILPFEGATAGHKYYEEVKLMLAIQALADKKYALARTKIAEARAWPINLGVGEPYEDMKDQRVIDWVDAELNIKMGNQANYQKLLLRITENTVNPASAATLLQLAAYKKLNKNKEAESLRKRWLESQKDSVMKTKFALMAETLDTVDIKQLINLTSHKEDERLF